MKIVERTSTHLQLVHRSSWFSLVWPLLALACLYLLHPPRSNKPWAIAVLIVLGCLFALRDRTVNCDFDKSRNMMVLTRHRLFGKKVAEYPLEEISAVEVVERMNRLFIFSYGIRLVLKSRVLELTVAPIYTQGEAGNIGASIARFLDVPYRYLPAPR